MLVTGGFGLVLSFSSLGLLLMSTTLALAIVLRPPQGLASLVVLALIVLCEILIFSLAAGALLIGVGLFLKGLADAFMRSFGAHKPGGLVGKMRIISRTVGKEFDKQDCQCLQIGAGQS